MYVEPLVVAPPHAVPGHGGRSLHIRGLIGHGQHRLTLSQATADEAPRVAPGMAPRSPPHAVPGHGGRSVVREVDRASGPPPHAVPGHGGRSLRAGPARRLRRTASRCPRPRRTKPVRGRSEIYRDLRLTLSQATADEADEDVVAAAVTIPPHAVPGHGGRSSDIPSPSWPIWSRLTLSQATADEAHAPPRPCHARGRRLTLSQATADEAEAGCRPRCASRSASRCPRPRRTKRVRVESAVAEIRRLTLSQATADEAARTQAGEILALSPFNASAPSNRILQCPKPRGYKCDSLLFSARYGNASARTANRRHWRARELSSSFMAVGTYVSARWR